MGIEPTGDNPGYPPNRFEACGAHQALIFPLTTFIVPEYYGISMTKTHTNLIRKYGLQSVHTLH